MKFTIFDVETPNLKNNRICALALVLIEDWQIREVRSYLINPKCDFYLINMNLHGITPSMVINSPVFTEVWKEIRPFFYDSIVMGYGVKFDLSVLKKTLLSYRMTEEPIQYLDLLSISKHFLPNLPNYKLETVCRKLNIDFIKEHNAEKDSIAAAELALKIFEKKEIPTPTTFSLAPSPDMDPKSTFVKAAARFEKVSLSRETRELQQFTEILKFLSQKGEIDVDDFDILLSWIDAHNYLQDSYPFDKIFVKIVDIIDDGFVEDSELQDLLKLCSEVTNPVESFFDARPDNISGKNIILTGNFNRGQKKDIISMLNSQGANAADTSVTYMTDIVLVGEKGNASWKMGNYGSKIKKAMELKDSGYNILIIKENDFFKD